MSSVGCERERQRIRRLLELLLERRLGRVVRNRRNADEDVAVAGTRQHGVGHLRGAGHVDAGDAGRRGKRGRTGHDRDVATRFGGGLRQREAHLAGTRIRDAAHGVDGLERRAGRDQHAPSCEHLRLPRCDQRGEQRRGLEHPAVAVLPCRRARRRPDRGRRCRRRAIARRCAAWPDAPTSAGSSRERRAAGTRARGTAWTSRSSARPCASFARKSADAGATRIASAPRDTPMCPIAFVGAGVPQVRQHGPPGQRLERQRRDESGCGIGHHHVHRDSRLHEQARQLRGLVRRDAARDAQHDAARAGAPELRWWSLSLIAGSAVRLMGTVRAQSLHFLAGCPSPTRVPVECAASPLRSAARKPIMRVAGWPSGRTSAGAPAGARGLPR